MHNSKCRKIREKVKSFLDLSDKEVLEWWNTPNAAFDGLTPNEMSKDPVRFNKMQKIINFSQEPLDRFEGSKKMLKNEKPYKNPDDDLPF